MKKLLGLQSLLALSVLACGEAAVPGTDGTRPIGVDDSGEFPSNGGDGDLVGGDGDNQGGNQGIGPGLGSCAGIEASADARLLPIDIVWAIDGSGSMISAFPAIQQALSKFSQDVKAAGLDAHIVLLTSQGLCVPAPLGSGSCGSGLGGGLGGGFLPPASAPDSKAPAFLHLDVSFGANQGMGVILDNYAHYKQMLRPDARTHLVLTEDGVPPMSAKAVVDHIEGRVSASSSPAWSPALKPGSWVFSGVVCANGLGDGACNFAFLKPETTLSLISMSDGVSADLSLAGQQGADPFASLLTELAARVIVGAELSCEYDIPATPAGESFDRERVNVLYGSESGAEKKLIPRTESACGDTVAWTYDKDDAPTKILLCPKACELVRTGQDASLDVEFGCQTAVIF